jgi:hypothetical protein
VPGAHLPLFSPSPRAVDRAKAPLHSVCWKPQISNRNPDIHACTCNDHKINSIGLKRVDCWLACRSLLTIPIHRSKLGPPITYFHVFIYFSTQVPQTLDILFMHKSTNRPSWNWKQFCQCIYSLQVGKRSRFRQRHGLQSITLTLFFYKNIYLKVIYVYFYENIFQDKSIHIVFIFPNLTT